MALLLATPACPPTHHARARPQWEGWTCNDVSRLPPGADTCTFVREKCESESLVDYLGLYYCHVRPHGAALGWLMLVSERPGLRWMCNGLTTP